MVSKDGTYTIYCSNSPKAPNCAGQKTSLEEQNIIVYPNPARERLNINGLTEENTIITINDLLGKVVRTFTLSQGENSMDVNDLKTGLYFIKFTQFDGSVFQKTFMIE